jgi:hypothetical protein
VLSLHGCPLPGAWGFPNRVYPAEARGRGGYSPACWTDLRYEASTGVPPTALLPYVEAVLPCPESEAKPGSTLPRSRALRLWGRTKVRGCSRVCEREARRERQMPLFAGHSTSAPGRI